MVGHFTCFASPLPTPHLYFLGYTPQRIIRISTPILGLCLVGKLRLRQWCPELPPGQLKFCGWMTHQPRDGQKRAGVSGVL